MSDGMIVFMTAMTVLSFFSVLIVLVIPETKDCNIRSITLWLLAWVGSITITYFATTGIQLGYNRVQSSFREIMRQEAIAALNYQNG